uniref:Uncharacterized protein n=1 Tax=Panagrellus redivivus TaxID=6233 RepID=A0A7E4ZUL1_PANRE
MSVFTHPKALVKKHLVKAPSHFCLFYQLEEVKRFQKALTPSFRALDLAPMPWHSQSSPLDRCLQTRTGAGAAVPLFAHHSVPLGFMA